MSGGQHANGNTRRYTQFFSPDLMMGQQHLQALLTSTECLLPAQLVACWQSHIGEHALQPERAQMPAWLPGGIMQRNSGELDRKQAQPFSAVRSPASHMPAVRQA